MPGDEVASPKPEPSRHSAPVPEPAPVAAPLPAPLPAAVPAPPHVPAPENDPLLGVPPSPGRWLEREFRPGTEKKVLRGEKQR